MDDEPNFRLDVYDLVASHVPLTDVSLLAGHELGTAYGAEAVPIG